MHLGRHGGTACDSAEHAAEEAVGDREEGSLQGGRREASGSQSGCTHQAAER